MRIAGALLGLSIASVNVAYARPLGQSPTLPLATTTPTATTTTAPAATPTPNACVVKVPSALRITWKTNEPDATVCEPDPTAGHSESVRALPKPAVFASPGTIITAEASALRGNESGIAISFRATKAWAPTPTPIPGMPVAATPSSTPTSDFKALRTKKGFESLGGEDRFVVVVYGLDATGNRIDKDKPLTVFANRNGACRIDGPNTGDLHDACAVTKAPTAVELAKSPAPKAPTGCLSKKDVTKTPADTADLKSVFCGAVIVQFKAIYPALRVPVVAHERTQEVEICTAFADRDLSSNDVLACDKKQLTYQADMTPRPTYHGSNGKNPGGSASAGASGTTAAAAHRSTLVANAPVAAGNSGSGTQAGVGNGLVYDLHVAFPVGSGARGSVAFDRFNLGSLLDRLQQNLGAASGNSLVQNALTQDASKLVPSDNCGKKCPDDSYKKLDAGIFDLVTNPFRTGVATKFADFEVDLKPVDFATITNVNYGAKFVGTPRDMRFGLAWYRDIDNVATGTAVHVDRDLGDFSFGVTHLVANMDPAMNSNKYRVDTAHTSSSVYGAAFRFGGGKSLQLFERYGVLDETGQRDRLTVLTWSPSDIAKPIDDAGTSWHPFAGVGYRSIDTNYDPLGTSYDQFVGTHSVFASVGYGRFPANDGSDADIQVALTGVRAWDSVQARYSAVVASLTAKLWKQTNDKAPSLILSHKRSAIAASVYARGDTSVLVTDADEGRNLLPNDSASIKLAYANGGWSYSAGPTSTYAPKKCDVKLTPHCQANANRQLGYDIHTTDDTSPLFAKFSMDLAPQQQAAFGQKAVAASQLDAKAVLRYAKCGSPHGLRFQPSMTYDSNISQNDSSYTPGYLVEASLDIGLGKVGGALRTSYKLVHPQNAADAALAQHGLFFGIASDNVTTALAKRCSPK